MTAVPEARGGGLAKERREGTPLKITKWNEFAIFMFCFGKLYCHEVFWNCVSLLLLWGKMDDYELCLLSFFVCFHLQINFKQFQIVLAFCGLKMSCLGFCWVMSCLDCSFYS